MSLPTVIQLYLDMDSASFPGYVKTIHVFLLSALAGALSNSYEQSSQRR